MWKPLQREGMQMNWRLRALVCTLFVVLATMAWTPYASAAIVVNSSLLPQTSQLSSGGMSAPVRPVDVPSSRFDRDTWDTAVLEGLISFGGASAPPSTSSATSVSAVAAVFPVVHVPPPLVARLTTANGPQ